MSTPNDRVEMSYLIDDHVRYLRASGKSEATVHARETVLRRLHNELPYGLAYASTDELEEWLGNPAWSQWTRATYGAHIRGFYGWGVGRELESDPTIGMARPKGGRLVPNPVTTRELELALERSPAPWHPGIMLAAFAGLRVSELARLERADVTEQSIRVRVAKGGSPAIVDTHPILWELIRDQPPGRLVRDPHGRAIDGRWFSDRSSRYFRRIGLPGVRMHRFRHWYGTELLARGADLETVRQALRHQSVTSTVGYTLIRNGQRRSAIHALPVPNQPLSR